MEFSNDIIQRTEAKSALPIQLKNCKKSSLNQNYPPIKPVDMPPKKTARTVPTGKITYHKDPLELIAAFKNPRRVTLLNSKSPLHRLKAVLKYHSGRFSISITAPRSNPFSVNVGRDFNRITVNTKPKPTILEEIFISSQRTLLLSGSIDRVYSKGYQKNRPYYYRLIIPLEKSLDFHYMLEESMYTTDLGWRSRTGSQVKFTAEDLTVCVYKHDDYHFISIDSTKRQTYESFSEKTFAIQCGLAFLTGYFPGNGGFFFAYATAKMKNHHHFYYTTTRQSIRTTYYPIYTNPLGLIHRAPKLARKYYDRKILRPLSIDEFSILCSRLHDSIKFRSLILLVIQSMGASMEQMPGGISIALEMLSNIIPADASSNPAPITNLALKDKVFEELQKVIEDNKTALGNDSHKILIKRLPNLNQPPNMDKLRAPFDAMGIELSEQDLIAIDSRNKFLHGQIPDILKLGKTRSNIRKTRDAYYCGVRLYTLINMLILKWVGYDNYVVNHPVIHNNICEVPTKEKPYRAV
jgi:hypothetical protein